MDLKKNDRKTQIAILSTIQGLYFFVTGVWPLIHVDSFMAITGPKADVWLVKTVGVLIFVIGTGLMVAGIKRRVTFPVAFIAAGSATGLFLIDVVYVWIGVISPIYLLDAIIEIILVMSWCILIMKTSLFTRFVEAE